MPPELLQRVSVRWLPDPAFEDTETIALNVGGYFLDLRVTKSDGSIQWSRAGERKVLKQEPLAYQWTRIIDSSGVLDPDEAAWDWEKLGNGDAFEWGTANCPLKDGALTTYEEIWRRVSRSGPKPYSWILQSVDRKTFLGCIGGTYVGMRSNPDGVFVAKWQEWDSKAKAWMIKFDGDHGTQIPLVDSVVNSLPTRTETLVVADKVVVGHVEYVVRAFESTIA